MLWSNNADGFIMENIWLFENLTTAPLDLILTYQLEYVIFNIRRYGNG